MVKVALVVHLRAKPGKGNDVAELLTGGLALVEAEPGTTTWFALRFGVDTFGIFDAFPDDAARQAHLVGKVAAALKDNEYLFEATPQLETADVLAAKIPSKV
jgi:quinol monooxygenase YgiN